MSSCGLFVKHFYREILTKFLTEEYSKTIKEHGEVDVHKLMVYLYDSLWEAIDAKDNGVPYTYLKKIEKKTVMESASVFAKPEESVYESDTEETGRHDPVSCNQAGDYRIEYNYWDNLSLGSLVSSMNGPDVYDHEDQLVRFMSTVELTWMFMKQLMIGKINRFFLMKDADELTVLAMKTRFDFHSSGQILYLERDNFLSSGAIKRYEKSHPDEFPDHDSKIKFLVYPISSGEYRVGTIQGANYTKRMALLPQERLQELISEELGKDIIFVHARGLFVGGAKTLETAKAMVVCSYEERLKEKKGTDEE